MRHLSLCKNSLTYCRGVPIASHPEVSFKITRVIFLDTQEWQEVPPGFHPKIPLALFSRDSKCLFAGMLIFMEILEMFLSEISPEIISGNFSELPLKILKRIFPKFLQVFS